MGARSTIRRGVNCYWEIGGEGEKIARRVNTALLRNCPRHDWGGLSSTETCASQTVPVWVELYIAQYIFSAKYFGIPGTTWVPEN